MDQEQWLRGNLKRLTSKSGSCPPCFRRRVTSVENFSFVNPCYPAIALRSGRDHRNQYLVFLHWSRHDEHYPAGVVSVRGLNRLNKGSSVEPAAFANVTHITGSGFRLAQYSRFFPSFQIKLIWTNGYQRGSGSGRLLVDLKTKCILETRMRLIVCDTHKLVICSHLLKLVKCFPLVGMENFITYFTEFGLPGLLVDFF